MENNWAACCFEIVEQKNNKVQKEEKLFFQKQTDAGDLKAITQDQFYKIETNRIAAEEAEEEIEFKENEIAMNLKEVWLDKRQKSFIGLAEGADGKVTPTIAKSAWPEFIPDEAIDWIQTEAKQVEKITNSELLPIEEESSARKPV